MCMCMSVVCCACVLRVCVVCVLKVCVGCAFLCVVCCGVVMCSVGAGVGVQCVVRCVRGVCVGLCVVSVVCCVWCVWRGLARGKTTVCMLKMSPCVGSKRISVYRQNARMLNTCARFAGTHGSVSNLHMETF